MSALHVPGDARVRRQPIEIVRLVRAALYHATLVALAVFAILVLLPVLLSAAGAQAAGV